MAAARGDRPPVAVYCPRASEFFGHPAGGHPSHRYREMLAAGVPVALGTDSAIVLGDAPSISVLDEMRLLPGYNSLRDVCNEYGVEVFESVMSLTGMVNVGKGSLVIGFASEPHTFTTS